MFEILALVPKIPEPSYAWQCFIVYDGWNSFHIAKMSMSHHAKQPYAKTSNLWTALNICHISSNFKLPQSCWVILGNFPYNSQPFLGRCHLTSRKKTTYSVQISCPIVTSKRWNLDPISRFSRWRHLHTNITKKTWEVPTPAWPSNAWCGRFARLRVKNHLHRAELMRFDGRAISC